MASIGGRNGDAFPAVNPTRELNLGVPEEFPVDPVSSDLETAKRLKEEAEARKRAAAAAASAASKEDGKCKCDLSSVLMSTLTVTVVVAAAIGVAFIIAKKLKHI